MIKKEVFIQSKDAEFSKRLAKMLELEGYSNYVIIDLYEVVQIVKASSSSVIVIECQSDCTHNRDESEVVKELSMNTSAQLLIITTAEESAEIRQFINSDRIHFLFKPILHSDFVKTVVNLLECVES